MEKYARQALSEGIKNPDDLRIALDSELYRVLNLHYNRNNHIEVRIRNEQVPGAASSETLRLLHLYLSFFFCHF